MKRTLHLLIAMALSFSVSFAQHVIVIHPGPATAYGASVSTLYPSTNMGNYNDFLANCWTNGGVPFVQRGLVRFDLSVIPTGATIDSAILSLQANPYSSNAQGSSSLSGSNVCWLQRITSSWDNNTVTWNTQPTTTTTDEVTIAQSTSTTENYPDINVTTLIEDMINNPSTSFGFEIQLQTEQYYRSMIFASGDETADTLLGPMLTIYYGNSDEPITCFTLKPSGDEAKEAAFSTLDSTTSYGNYNDFLANCWTYSGTPFVQRAVMAFDLSSVPVNATITSASLSLYHNPNSSNAQGCSSLSGSNIAWLQRITSTWGENTVTWVNQPTTTTVDEVTLPQSTSTTEDYPNINVTTLVQDMVNNPSSSFGFEIKLQTEQYYRSMIFASGHNTDTTILPTLKVCYSKPNNICCAFPKLNFNVFPNPNNGSFSVSGLNAGNYTIELFNVLGERIINNCENLSETAYFNFSSILSTGIYFIKLSRGNLVYSKKIIIN